jgi:hypothetical protein
VLLLRARPVRKAWSERHGLQPVWPDRSPVPVSQLPTSALSRQWRRTTVALGDRLDPRTRQALVQRWEEVLDELERRDPIGFARWLAVGRRRPAIEVIEMVAIVVAVGSGRSWRPAAFGGRAHRTEQGRPRPGDAPDRLPLVPRPPASSLSSFSTAQLCWLGAGQQARTVRSEAQRLGVARALPGRAAPAGSRGVPLPRHDGSGRRRSGPLLPYSARAAGGLTVTEEADSRRGTLDPALARPGSLAWSGGRRRPHHR